MEDFNIAQALNSKGTFWRDIFNVVAQCVISCGSKFSLTSVSCIKQLRWSSTYTEGNGFSMFFQCLRFLSEARDAVSVALYEDCSDFEITCLHWCQTFQKGSFSIRWSRWVAYSSLTKISLCTTSEYSICFLLHSLHSKSCMVSVLGSL